MAVIKGKDGELTVDTTAVGKIQSWAISESIEEIQDDGMGDDWTSVAGGQKTWGAEVQLLDDAADTGQDALVVGAEVAAVFRPEGTGAGLDEKTGNALVSAVNPGQSKTGAATLAVSLKGQGALTAAAQI